MADLEKRGLRPPTPCPKWGCLGGQSRSLVRWVGGVQLHW